MFSQTAEYALRAMVFLGEKGGDRWTSKQIAAATQIPAGYLAKVLQTLARQGLVEAQRGREGGFSLVREPGSVSLLEILQAVDPPQRITRCPLDLPEHRAGLCRLHRRLDDAMAHVEETFSRSTVLDLMEEDTFPEGSGEVSASPSS
jgi:Rrf2 family nitric oxide-sensitive transcriptional repressor